MVTHDTYTSCLLLSNTLHDAAFCGEERWASTGTEGGAVECVGCRTINRNTLIAVRRTQNQSLLGKLLSTTQNKPRIGADTFSLYIINLGICHVRIRVPTGKQKPTQHGSWTQAKLLIEI
ncbi:hypothetical protein M405DRAFT_116747 [Rhizopogon salebrosus TDB-379]|nr:hypothetical protein M405DRAFT_116747 [Rhizopogon salebrosus TDB-379]